MEEFREPVYWASLNVYGRDSIINVEDLQRIVAEASFVKAQKMAVERFEFVQRNEGNTEVTPGAKMVTLSLGSSVSMFHHYFSPLRTVFPLSILISFSIRNGFYWTNEV